MLDGLNWFCRVSILKSTLLQGLNYCSFATLHGLAYCCMVWDCVAWWSMIFYGSAWFGMVWHGLGLCCMMVYGFACCMFWECVA